MTVLWKKITCLSRTASSCFSKMRDRWLPQKKKLPRNFEDSKTADIFLIQTPAWGINTPPLAIAQLTGYLKNKGVNVFAHDLNIELYQNRGEGYKNAWELGYSYLWENSSWVDEIWENHHNIIDPLLDAISSSTARLIGLSVYCSSFLTTMKIAGEIKQRSPEKLIVLGGPHMSRLFAGLATI